MIKHERMLQGVGFYFHRTSPKPEIPSFSDLRQMVEETAYYLWINAGSPHGERERFWFQAERELFGGVVNGGYRIFVCDLDDAKNKGHLRHWDMCVRTPHGIVGNHAQL